MTFFDILVIFTCFLWHTMRYHYLVYASSIKKSSTFKQEKHCTKTCFGLSIIIISYFHAFFTFAVLQGEVHVWQHSLKNRNVDKLIKNSNQKQHLIYSLLHIPSFWQILANGPFYDPSNVWWWKKHRAYLKKED